jgi:hypothetical protein
MTARTPSNALFSVLAVAPLLITESVDEFADFYAQLEQEIGPSGVIERIFVRDVAASTWDILRLQRCKTATINLESLNALKLLLLQLLDEHDKMVPHARIHYLPSAGLLTKALDERSWNCWNSSVLMRQQSKPKPSKVRRLTLQQLTKC